MCCSALPPFPPHSTPCVAGQVPDAGGSLQAPHCCAHRCGGDLHMGPQDGGWPGCEAAELAPRAHVSCLPFPTPTAKAAPRPLLHRPPARRCRRARSRWLGSGMWQGMRVQLRLLRLRGQPGGALGLVHLRWAGGGCEVGSGWQEVGGWVGASQPVLPNPSP